MARVPARLFDLLRDSTIRPVSLPDDPHRLQLQLDPVLGTTGAYSFASPELDLHAVVSDAAPEIDFFESIWGQVSEGMGLFRAWVAPMAVGSAVVEVAAKPGTLPARILCGPSAPSCDPITAPGVVAVFDQAPYRAYNLTDWWNPRRDGTG